MKQKTNSYVTFVGEGAGTLRDVGLSSWGIIEVTRPFRLTPIMMYFGPWIEKERRD